MPPGLAVLELDEVEDLLLSLEHEVVEAEQDSGSLRDRTCGPGLLDTSGALGRGRDVGGRAVRDLPEHAAGHRVGDVLAGVGVGRLDAGRQ